MSDEKRYTMLDAELAIAQRDCAMSGHEAHHIARSADGTPVPALCKCGLYTWQPARFGKTRQAS